LGVPAPPSPDAATGRNDAPPIPTVADFTRRDPQTASLHNLGDFDPARRVEDYALSWGQNQLNSSAEALVSRLTDNARARVNFRFDRHGRIEGEADVLLPLVDTPRALFFTQLGVRNMTVNVPQGEANDKDRWIGNFGLGQRFFPNATQEDSGNWMFGFNFFFDHDFTRAHNRGGVGVELQYEGVRVSSNLYVPLSDWKNSHDYGPRFRKENPGKFMEERPAKGWDVHVEAPLPFYPSLAFTGGLTRWYGDKVDTLGHGALKKDPKTWEFGVKYTPFPPLSLSVTQRNTEGGRQDTVVGLSFTLHLGMSWRQQTNPAKVRKSTTVSGVRYDPVERENRMPLARQERQGPSGPSGPLATGGTVTFQSDPSQSWEIHTFFDSGTFTYLTAYQPAVDYLIVAGGGGSGGGRRNFQSDYSGGGGAGGLLYRTGQTLPLTNSAVEISVGAGGEGGTGDTYGKQGENGAPSKIGTIEVPGGGGGGGSTNDMAGRDGGSGGGSGAGAGTNAGSGGSRIADPTDMLGYAGGVGGKSGSLDSGGSGGGAGGAGKNGAANGSMVAGGDPWTVPAGASWIVAATNTTEFSRGGNGGSPNAESEPSQRAGKNYGDGGAGGKNDEKPGAAGHGGIVVIRFPLPPGYPVPASP
jgi:hypothetical protein